jgi:F-type H+-transporting ATPase subunit alpha
LDKVLTSEIAKFEEKFLTHLRTNHSALVNRIRDTGDFTDNDDRELAGIVSSFISESGLKMKA